jgi:hypothetical protein
MLQKEKYPNVDSSINVLITFALFGVQKHKILFSYTLQVHKCRRETLLYDISTAQPVNAPKNNKTI